MAARPFRLTATGWKIEAWPSDGLYRSRSWAPPASPADPCRMPGPGPALYSSSPASKTSMASFLRCVSIRRPLSVVRNPSVRIRRVRRLRLTCRVELTHQGVSLPALQERVGRLPDQIEAHCLGAVGREPSRIVAGCATTARIERRPPVRDAEQGERPMRRLHGVGGEAGGGEQDSHLDVRLLQMIPQGLDLEATYRRLLSSTHDHSSAPPDGERDDAFEFEQVSLLRLGRGHTPVDAEVGDLEPHFAQFAYDQDLEVFGCELRQFQHPSS